MNRVSSKVLNLISAYHNYNKYVVMLRRNSHKSFSVFPNALFSQAFHRLKISAFLKLNTLLDKRDFSSNSDDDGKKNKPALLMKFDPVLKPEIMLTIKNWILTKLIVQPYLDNDFTLKDFTNGSKQALSIVSSLLSQGDFQSLKGLVSDEAIKEIKSNYSALNLKERQDLFIRVTDVLFAFPYQIGIFFDDTNQKRFAEITVVYHCLNDYEELKSQGKIFTEDARADIKICNYRFIREYTKGIESDWTVNRLGHFKLSHFEN